MKGFILRFFTRLGAYSTSGISTYLLDLLIIAILVTYGVNYTLAIVIGYAIGVSLNYYLCHTFVYQGTLRKFWQGYAFFICLAVIGMGAILVLVEIFLYLTDWNLLIIRTLVACIVGFFGFIINTFFNFRLL